MRQGDTQLLEQRKVSIRNFTASMDSTSVTTPLNKMTSGSSLPVATNRAAFSTSLMVMVLLLLIGDAISTPPMLIPGYHRHQDLHHHQATVASNNLVPSLQATKPSAVHQALSTHLKSASSVKVADTSDAYPLPFLRPPAFGPLEAIPLARMSLHRPADVGHRLSGSRFRKRKRAVSDSAAAAGVLAMNSAIGTNFQSGSFSGLPDAEISQLSDLGLRDPIAATFEFNERVLKIGSSGSKTCSMRLRLNSSTTAKLAEVFKDQVQSVLQTANTLNNAMLSVTDPLALSESFYVALVKGLVSSDRLVYGAVVVLDPGHAGSSSSSSSSTASRPHVPYAFRNSSTGHLQIRFVDVVREVSREYKLPNSSSDEFAWFRHQRQSDFSEQLWPHQNVCRKVAAALVDSSATGGRPSGTAAAGSPGPGAQATVVTTAAEGLWGAPQFNCAQARSWTVAFSVPFFGCTPQERFGFRGVIKVDLDLGAVDINQCTTDSRQLFPASHRCPPSTRCVHVPNGGFRRGSYRCICPSGFYPTPSSGASHAPVPSHADDGATVGDHSTSSAVNRSTPSLSASGFNGSILEHFYVDLLLNDPRRSARSAATTADSRWRCVECQCKSTVAGCSDNGAACYAGYDAMLRGIPLAVQSLCVTITMILTVVVVRLRKTKVMKASFWCFLEVVLIGALMLYSTVIIQYFEPTNACCLLIPWLREVGFAVIYGALVLKVYRILAEFQSRKAHRVQIRDKDLFKYLCYILVVVIGYMAAWTAVTLDYLGEHGSMLQTGFTIDNLRYVVCQSKWWDYVVETGELLFMCFSIYVCYCTRAAPSNYREVRYISWTIYNEAIISTIFYTTRHVFWLYVHPDYIFLMYFVRCQLTVSVMLLLVLGPKLWYSRRPLDDEAMRERAYSTCEGGQGSAAVPAGTGLVEPGKIAATGLNLNGDVDVGEINLSEMNPEDIRCELKRLYTQLQIYKTKAMRQDNPHISKRRGGRKQTHRRFSLQAFHNKHKYGGGHHSGAGGDRGSAGSGAVGGGVGGGGHGVIGGETEVSRSPEDSVNSQEGVSVYADEGSVAEMRSPAVSFKPGHRGKHAS